MTLDILVNKDFKSVTFNYNGETYSASSSNKAFDSNMGGNSLYATLVDGNPRYDTIRVDNVMHQCEIETIIL